MIKVHKKKAVRNKKVKTAVKAAFKNANLTLVNKGAEVEKNVKEAIIKIDKAVSKGVFHKNKAARKKSRITKKLNKIKEEVAA